MKNQNQLLQEISDKLCCLINAMAEDPLPQLDGSVDTYCDETTNTLWCKTITFTDGVPGAPVLTDLGIACDLEIDVRPSYVCNSATGFYDLIVDSFDNEGVQVGTVATATTIECVANDQEGLTPTWFCDVDGDITGGITWIHNSDGTIDQLFFDANGQPSTTAPTGSICQAKDYEHKSSLFCFEDTAGIQTTKEVCRTYIDGVVQPDIIAWHLPDGTTTDIQPAGLTPCQDEDTNSCVEIDRQCFSKTVTSIRYDNSAGVGISSNTPATTDINGVGASSTHTQDHTINSFIYKGQVVVINTPLPATTAVVWLQSVSDIIEGIADKECIDFALKVNGTPVFNNIEITTVNPDDFGILEMTRDSDGKKFFWNPIQLTLPVTTRFSKSVLYNCILDTTNVVWTDEGGNIVTPPADIDCYESCGVEPEVQTDKINYTPVAECWTDVNGDFKKVFNFLDTTTFPATSVGYTEEDLVTVADLTAWVKSEICNCSC